MMLYSVAIHQENGRFVAHVPDLPTLHADGGSMAEVIGNVRLAIIEYLQSLVSSNHPVPAGQDIGVHLTNPDFFGHTWAIIGLDSLRISQHLISVDLELPKSLLLSIYYELGDGEGSDVSQEMVRNYVIEAIKERLRHSPKNQAKSGER